MVQCFAFSSKGRSPGKWPNTNSGDVVDAPGEKWKLIDSGLREGQRGLPGGSSLAKLLAKKQGLRNPAELPPLTEAEILRLADLHFQGTGKYPFYKDGRVADALGETWAAFDMACISVRHHSQLDVAQKEHYQDDDQD